ncbi:MAG TPA: serine/threonine-protein kinase [Gemmataceae bacterium]|nr:serine/threonine-protein kinase [Gemmataceae bacterium]
MNSREDRRPELEDPRVVEALDEFLAALEDGHTPERQTFLAQHPEIAAALAECLEGMDVLHQSNSVRQRTANSGAAAADWQPGIVLGDFRILREVGRGGMGVVYEAEQVSLGRRIALKVLPFALTLDTRQLQRFKNEARAAAQLHHQHIVPVYYVGSERGVHFYAMQYIDGQSLAELIHGLRQLTKSGEGPAVSRAEPALRQEVGSESTGSDLPGSRVRPPTTDVRNADTLTTAYSAESPAFYLAVAKLGVQAAEALEHAHELGVVHREVKPANIMVDGQGHLWVTDFGLAQFQADTCLTQSGDLLGTLRYMSPEQAGGHRVLLDHRTDVYSLGATLYELLTLRPPFGGRDRQTLLQQILYDEPRPLRALRKSVPVELETILMKCLEKDVGRRYATARELADDLRRFLAHEPIRARKATPAQRLRKWARRHPSLVWAGVLLCVLTVAGSLVSAALLRREQANTQIAYENERRACENERQRSREAEERFLLAREELDGMFKLCEEELADKPHLDGIRRRLLENFLVYYQRLIEQRQDDPAETAELAASRARVRQILDDLALLQGAGQHVLLKEEAVLDDLCLSQQQRDRVQKITEAMDRRGKESVKDLSRLTPEKRRELFVHLIRLTEADIEKDLTAEQRQRLRQIDLQRKGERAFQEPDISAVLKLTAGQKEQIRVIRDKAFGRRRRHSEGPGGSPSAPDSIASLVAQIEDNVLTKEQRERWHELIGKPFNSPPSHAAPGRP